MSNKFTNTENLLIIRSSIPSLLELFIKECENIGWKYNDNFTDRSEVKNYIITKDKGCCLYFSSQFECFKNIPAFALSYSGGDGGEKIYNLDTQFIEALEAAKLVYINIKLSIPNIIVHNISKDYNAIITSDAIISVGCQTITFEKFDELAKAVEMMKINLQQK